jgi:hypothetical protein
MRQQGRRRAQMVKTLRTNAGKGLATYRLAAHDDV